MFGNTISNLDFCVDEYYMFQSMEAQTNYLSFSKPKPYCMKIIFGYSIFSQGFGFSHG